MSLRVPGDRVPGDRSVASEFNNGVIFHIPN